MQGAQTYADGSGAANARALERTRLAAWRSVEPIALFRTVVGAALCAFFLMQQRRAAPLVDGGLLAETTLPVSAVALCGLAALLSLGVALNAWPRACALLLLPLAVLMQRALAPVARLDDWMSVVLAWWMVLWPRVELARSARQRGVRSIAPAGAVAVMLAHVLLLYLWLGGVRAMSPAWPPAEPRWLVAVFSLVPGLYLLPLGPLRWLGPPIQLALHGYLAAITGEWLAHTALAASSVLLAGELRARRVALGSAGVRIDAPCVLALGYSGLLLLAAGGSALGLGATAQRARHALADLGLAPVRAPVAALDEPLQFREDDGVLRPWSEVSVFPDARDARTRLIASHLLAASRGEQASVRATAQRALGVIALRYCEQLDASGERSRPIELILDDRRYPVPRALARFDCALPERSAYFLSGG